MYAHLHKQDIHVYLPPHPDSHRLGSNRGPDSKPFLLPHELIQKEGLARVELPHNTHHCHCRVNVVQVLDILTDDLQLSVVVGVWANQL